jgi:hypothetical protein
LIFQQVYTQRNYSFGGEKNMEWSDASLDKEYEKLNEAIMKAIVTSGEIKSLLSEYKSKDMIKHMAVLNLILSLEELSDVIFSEETSYALEELKEPVAKNEQQVKGKSEPLTQFHIDGKSLTRNEILFERFCQGKFDETEWMKKIKIKI